MKQCIEYQESLTGVQVKRFGGDSIYANNANRSFSTEKGITTSFVRKGPKPQRGGKRDTNCKTYHRDVTLNHDGRFVWYSKTALWCWSHSNQKSE